MGSHQPMSQSVAGHDGDNPSTNDHKVGGKKGKGRIPCRLCRDVKNQTSIFLLMFTSGRVECIWMYV
jgi:hypothetical protein